MAFVGQTLPGQKFSLPDTGRRKSEDDSFNSPEGPSPTKNWPGPRLSLSLLLLRPGQRTERGCRSPHATYLRHGGRPGVRDRRPVFMDPVEIPYRGGPVVSPDGQWVAFAVQETGPVPNTGVRVVPARGGMSRELARKSGESRSVWDGRRTVATSFGTSRRPGRAPAVGYTVYPWKGGRRGSSWPMRKWGTFSGFSGDGSRLLWGTGSSAPNGPGYRVTNLTGESLAYLPRPEGSLRVRHFSFDGFSTLGLGVEMERAVIAQPPGWWFRKDHAHESMHPGAHRPNERRKSICVCLRLSRGSRRFLETHASKAAILHGGPGGRIRGVPGANPGKIHLDGVYAPRWSLRPSGGSRTRW